MLAIPRVKATTIGPTAFGSRWRKMIRRLGTPRARAASANCISRNERNELRTIREIEGQLSSPKMSAIFQGEASPKTLAASGTSSRAGTVKKTSVTRIRTASSAWPK